ncbi:hypothetical protein AA0111_g11665 [Alternaria arborescens]|uniref:hypothetical protein n=1 Tax=Alternaria arborescens TaxID=156630 RepID=UPI00107580F7|nr:hypothetical protein AA0111_g11665 [Alternaria arborescens]RYO15439.1 hypothetical protein AA0111_g11665 [Alternaria arborescens]
MASSNDYSVRKHAYEALESSRHIRLIILHPASSTDVPLKLTFKQARLSELQGRYEAISYTWGQPTLAYPLHVSDGTHVLVTENLDRALRYLRRSHKDRALWADAACINQADDVEKGTQIALMVNIFRGAGTVLAWLDPGSAVYRWPNLESTLEKMDNVSRTTWENLRSGCRVETEGDGGVHNAPLSKHSREVVGLLSLPWFNRLWIVQEVVFNQEVRLIYGGVELSWARFVAAMSILSTLDSKRQPSADLSFRSAAMKIIQLWRHHSLFAELQEEHGKPRVNSSTHHTDIARLVDDFALHSCTDPRDRIFALYSMASNLRPCTAASSDHDVLMNIDYSLDLRQTYEAFALACIRAGKLTKIIEAVLSRQHSPRPDGWMSWVPDWRVKWPKPVHLPQPVRFHRSFKLGESPPDVICIRISVFGHFLGTHDTANPTILVKATGETLFQQILDFDKKSRGPDGERGFRRLFDMLDCRLDPDDVTTLEQSLLYMASQTENTSLQSGPSSNSMELNDIVLDVKRIIGETNSLFYFEIPGTRRRSVGYGNAQLEAGDQLIPLNARIAEDERVQGMLKMVLILRSAGTINTQRGPKTIYRLIGSGYVYDIPDEYLATSSNDKAFGDCFRGLYLV